MPKRILILLSQLPQDPSSGAARNMRSIAEMLTPLGFEFECVATTATEQVKPEDPIDILDRAGCRLENQLPAEARREGSFIRFAHRAVSYHLLNTGPARILEWSDELDGALNTLLAERLAAFNPDLIFTYGGQPRELRRQRAAKDRGCAIVFALQNWGYLHPRAIPFADAVWTVSTFHQRVYREKVGIESTAIPNPILPEDALAPQRRPEFVTMINPSREKGVMLFARLAEMLCATRPDARVLVVEARGSAEELVRAGLDAGFDLRRHTNIVISPGVAKPSHIYAVTKLLLVPSALAEPSGRVAAEALINAIPPLVSDRGGLPETVEGGGIVLPMPAWLHADTNRVVSPEEAQPWLDAILRLLDDPSVYAEASARALAAGARHLPEQLAPRFAELFETVRRRA